MTDYKEIRHNLHEHPQTAGCEEYAHDTIVKHLQGLHPSKVYTHVGGYGVIAVWEAKENSSPKLGEVPEGRRSVPTIAFRADTDALPIGHRCGHDGHTTILLRLAELIDGLTPSPLQKRGDADASLSGQIPSPLERSRGEANILLLWQPAEETGTGSRAVLESGILQQYNIKAFYALHNLPGYPLGTVVLCPRTFAAASTGVVYHLDGRETHASTPEMGVNPGLAVAEIINRFNRFNGTNGQSGKFRQSTLIYVHIGSPAFGTSAGHGEVMFTLRAFSNDEMEKLLAEANQAVDEIASRYGLAVSRSLVEPFRATENNLDCVERVKKTVEELNASANSQFSILNSQYKEEPNRWSEDFAEYLLEFPGAMFGIGSGEHHPELHHPSYDFPDDIIEPAARLFLQLALNFCK